MLLPLKNLVCSPVLYTSSKNNRGWDKQILTVVFMTQIFGGTHIFKELEESVEQACRLIILFVRQNDISNARFDHLKEEIPEYYATLQTNPSLVRKSRKQSITWIAVHRLNAGSKQNLFSLSTRCCTYLILLFIQNTYIIHHNQLLMTKFGKNFCVTRKCRQNCSILTG